MHFFHFFNYGDIMNQNQDIILLLNMSAQKIYRKLKNYY